MKEIADLILQYGLGATAIAAITYIAVMLIKFIIKDLSGKIDTLYEIIEKLRDILK
jgi:phosphomevalonate kinase